MYDLLNHELLKLKIIGNMIGSQSPSEQLMIFPVAGVSDMTVLGDKPSEIAGLRVHGLECNLVALLLV